MFDHLLSIIAPHYCLGCDREGTLLCSDCSQRLPVLAERCYRCHALSPGGRTCTACRRQSPLHTVVAATAYGGLAKDLIWKLKFAHAPAATETIARTMCDRVAFANATLVHVPTATARVRQRGFDQAQLITRRLSRTTGLPYRNYLRRMGQARQVGAGKYERAEHLRTAFRAVHVPDLRNAHIILVDDVLTSGATLEAAARTLKVAGAKRIDAVVFAQA